MLFEILVKFLDEHKFAGWPHTHSEDDLILVQAEDLALLDQVQGLSVDELALELGQVLLVSHQQLPECLSVSEFGKLCSGRSFHKRLDWMFKIIAIIQQTKF